MGLGGYLKHGLQKHSEKYSVRVFMDVCVYRYESMHEVWPIPRVTISLNQHRDPTQHI